MDLFKFILKIYRIERHLKEIIMLNTELFDVVLSLAPQVAKIQAEVTDLNNRFNTASAGTVPDEVAIAIAAVQSSVAALDALVPDLPAA